MSVCFVVFYFFVIVTISRSKCRHRFVDDVMFVRLTYVMLYITHEETVWVIVKETLLELICCFMLFTGECELPV